MPQEHPHQQPEPLPHRRDVLKAPALFGTIAAAYLVGIYTVMSMRPESRDPLQDDLIFQQMKLDMRVMDQQLQEIMADKEISDDDRLVNLNNLFAGLERWCDIHRPNYIGHTERGVRTNRMVAAMESKIGSGQIQVHFRMSGGDLEKAGFEKKEVRVLPKR